MLKFLKNHVETLPTEYDPQTGALTKGQAKLLAFAIVLMTLGVVALYTFG